MKESYLVHWLLSIFSVLIITGTLYIGKKVTEIDNTLTRLDAIYNIEMPSIKKSIANLNKRIQHNTRDIEFNQKTLYLNGLLIAKKEEEERFE